MATNIGLNTPPDGSPSYRNAWASGIVNPNMDILDSYTSGVLSKDVSGSSNTVLALGSGSVGDAQHTAFKFTGTLTGAKYVLLPAGLTGRFSIASTATGFSLSFGCDNGSSVPAGSTVLLPSTGSVSVISDGTNVTVDLPVRTKGALLVGVTGGVDKLAVGTNGQVLTADSTQTSGVKWATSGGGYGSQTFTSSGIFTVPSGATSATVFKITAIGGGGGGGGATTPSASAAGGGASGGAITALFSGFTPSTSVTITRGAGGSAGSSSGGNGGTGGTTTVVYAAATIMSAAGGSGGFGGNLGGGGMTIGATSAAVGGSGLTLVTSYGAGAQRGLNGSGIFSGTNTSSGSGGGNTIGSGGSGIATGSGGTGGAGTFGGGGGGAISTSSGLAGGAGGNGIVIVEWWL
ncbi:MAG: hypothetical protein KGL39_04555 [Patescibacteria group bacterium]|nr:hypothetical protein [Patescibacteria group bacterium]